jgi:hypothetical protein
MVIPKPLESWGFSGWQHSEHDMTMTAVNEHPVLTRLCRRGFGSEQYPPWTGFLELGASVRNRMKIYNVAHPEIKDLAESTRI